MPVSHSLTVVVFSHRGRLEPEGSKPRKAVTEAVTATTPPGDDKPSTAWQDKTAKGETF